MIRVRHRALRVAGLAATGALALGAACTGGGPSSNVENEVGKTRAYLAALAPVLVARPLTAEEVETIEREAVNGDEGRQLAIDTIVGAWVEEPALGEAAREMVSLRLSTSGKSGDINFDLPGNLAAYTVANQLPWSTILTADYCVGDDGQQTACDSGAPYTAGLLTTRAYLKARASRFNLTRASTMMEAFACEGYPMADTTEPRIPRERLRVMFQAETPEDQEDPQVGDAFGNGFACYTCHGQFAWHAQLYVQFDQDGLFRSDATGLQDPEGELGRATGGLYASHFADPTEAANPASQILGQPVADLVAAGQVLGGSANFAGCTAHSLIEYGLGLDPGAEIAHNLIEDITATLGAPGTPSFADFVVAVFTNPRVFEAVSQSGSAQESSP